MSVFYEFCLYFLCFVIFSKFITLFFYFTEIYCKVYLLYDSKLVSKKKIRCRKRTADPVFDEAVHFLSNESEKVALALKQVSTGGPIVQPGAPGIMTFQASSSRTGVVANTIESTRSDTGLHKAASQQVMNSQSRSLSRTSLSKSDATKSNLSTQSSIEFPGSTAQYGKTEKKCILKRN